MDDLTAQARRRAKADIVRLFQESGPHMLDSLDLKSTDERLDIYCRKIISEPERHNLFELLAVKRFISFLQAFTFLPERVKVVI